MNKTKQIKINGWSKLKELCPVDISRIVSLHHKFESYLPASVRLDNINECKELVITARGYLDEMISVLIQLLYDKRMLKDREDFMLYSLLMENFARYLKFLDSKEDFYITRMDTSKLDLTGVSQISAYAKLLRNSVDILIFETLANATKEYLLQDKNEPKIFLYIFFQTLHVTLNVVGGITREKVRGKREGSLLTNMPIDYNFLMSDKGKDLIKKSYEEETGLKDLDDLEFIIEGDLEEDEYEENN